MATYPEGAPNVSLRSRIGALVVLVVFLCLGQVFVERLTQLSKLQQHVDAFLLNAHAPFPTDPQRDGDLRHYSNGDASFFAVGSMQGVAVVRSLTLSVTRNSSAGTGEGNSPGDGQMDSTSTECTIDRLTQVHHLLEHLINQSDAEVIFESTDGVDACTTHSVEKRLAVSTSTLDAFCASVTRIAAAADDVVLLGDRSETWELPNVNAAESAGELSVGLTIQKRRLERFQKLYTAAVNMTDKEQLLDAVLKHEREVLSLDRQLTQQESKTHNPRAVVVLRVVDRDIRGWTRARAEKITEFEESLLHLWRGAAAAAVALCVSCCVGLWLAVRRFRCRSMCC